MARQTEIPEPLRNRRLAQSELEQMTAQIPARVIAAMGAAYVEWLCAAALADARGGTAAENVAMDARYCLDSLRCDLAVFLEPQDEPVDPMPRSELVEATRMWVEDRETEARELARLDCLGWPDEATDLDHEHDEEIADLDAWTEENR